MITINPLSLVRERVAIPLLLFFLIGMTAMVFASGWLKHVGTLVVGMQLGIMIYGALIDPRFLNPEGLAKASLSKTKSGDE